MEDQTQVNIPLLRKVVEWAEAEAAKPDVDCEWEQAYYVSQPDIRAYAIATRRLPGHRMEEVRTLASELTPDCGTCYCIAGWVTAQAGIEDPDDFDEVAADLLGIGEWQATDLFAGNNSIADVRRIAEDIAGERL